MRVWGGWLPFLGFRTHPWQDCDCEDDCGAMYRNRGLMFEWLNYGIIIYGHTDVIIRYGPPRSDE